MAFRGFEAGGAAGSIPSQFFTQLLPLIDDEAELRFTSYAIFALSRRRGGMRLSQFRADEVLDGILAGFGGALRADVLAERAAERGGLLLLALDDGDSACFLNSTAGRSARARVARSGGLDPGSARGREGRAAVLTPAAAYEREIGRLSPSITEALAAAIEKYSEEAVVAAIAVAARYNARRWSYVHAVLKNGPAQGRAALPEGLVLER